MKFLDLSLNGASHICHAIIFEERNFENTAKGDFFNEILIRRFVSYCRRR